MKKSLMKGADLLKEAGVTFFLPSNVPAYVKELAEEMGMGMSETPLSGSTVDASRGASVHPGGEEEEEYSMMETCELNDAVLKNSL